MTSIGCMFTKIQPSSGFHTHLVLALQNGLRADIKTWILQNFFAKRCQGQIPADAVDSKSADVGIGLQLQAHRLRYICKGLDPEITDCGETGRRDALNCRLVGIPEESRRPAGLIECAQRCGVSQSLGNAVVKAPPIRHGTVIGLLGQGLVMALQGVGNRGAYGSLEPTSSTTNNAQFSALRGYGTRSTWIGS